MKEKDITIYISPTVERALAQLVEKIYLSAQRVLIVTPSKERSLLVDQFLWTYTPLSFLPHGCIEYDKDPLNHPIWISDTLENANNAQVVLSLTSEESILSHILHFKKKILLLSHTSEVFYDVLKRYFQTIVCWQQKEKAWVSYSE
jgi:DNA polymerase IIIc chi subunit